MRSNLGFTAGPRPAASSSFVPTDISGLVAWYDASDAGSITASGGAVSQWNDLSGNGYHLTQSTGALQPETGAATLNGLNVVTFGRDSQEYMETGTISVSGTSLTLLAVYAHVSEAASFNQGLSLATGFSNYMWYSDDRQNFQFYDVPGGAGTTATVNLGRSVATDGTEKQMYRMVITAGSGAAARIVNDNGDDATGSRSYTPSAYTITKLRLGSVIDRRLDAHVCEYILATSALAGTDLTDAENYLIDKWAIG